MLEWCAKLIMKLVWPAVAICIVFFAIMVSYTQGRMDETAKRDHLDKVPQPRFLPDWCIICMFLICIICVFWISECNLHDIYQRIDKVEGYGHDIQIIRQNLAEHKHKYNTGLPIYHPDW